LKRRRTGWWTIFIRASALTKRLYEQDITGSIAHATMLGEQGIIPKADADKIVEGLKGILADAKEGKIHWEVDAEDIHMNVEKILTERDRGGGKATCIPGGAGMIRWTLDTRMYAKAA